MKISHFLFDSQSNGIMQGYIKLTPKCLQAIFSHMHANKNKKKTVNRSARFLTRLLVPDKDFDDIFKKNTFHMIPF